MKKLMILASAFLLVFWAVGSVNAAPIVLIDVWSHEDYDSHGYGDPLFIDGIGDYLAWTHHFAFDPPAGEILSGELTLSLRDDERDRLNPLTWEIGVGWAEDGTWDIGGVNTGDYEYDVTASYLADGAFSIVLVPF